MADPKSVESPTEQQLKTLRQLIVDARAVPMSASCMVHRGEMLELIDKTIAGLPDDIQKSRSIIHEQYEAHAQAREKAEEILELARQEARQLASVSEIARQADAYAAVTRRAANDEAAQIRIEADKYIDARLAAYEAELQKSIGQVGIMRERLSQRSRLDHDEVEPLPSIT